MPDPVKQGEQVDRMARIREYLRHAEQDEQGPLREVDELLAWAADRGDRWEDHARRYEAELRSCRQREKGLREAIERAADRFAASACRDVTKPIMDELLEALAASPSTETSA